MFVYFAFSPGEESWWYLHACPLHQGSSLGQPRSTYAAVDNWQVPGNGEHCSESMKNDRKCKHKAMCFFVQVSWSSLLVTVTVCFLQPHRVLIPSSEAKNRVRSSLAFFVHPDNDELITCIDGSNKYPPITAAEFLAQQFTKSYGK